MVIKLYQKNTIDYVNLFKIKNKLTSMEDNLDELAERIFAGRPKPRCSIELQLEEDTADIAEDEGLEFIFKILYLLTHKGMQILFGEQNVYNLTEGQFNILQQYTNSYGYNIIVYANDTNRSPWSLQRDNQKIHRIKISFERITC